MSGKLERAIDEIKRSAYSSELRDFDFLWGRLQEHLVEEREDTNARSIELSLKPKSWKKDSKEKSNPLANPAKAATVPPPPPKETPAAPADPSSPKNDPKGKGGKGDKGKGEKGKGDAFRLCAWQFMRVLAREGQARCQSRSNG